MKANEIRDSDWSAARYSSNKSISNLDA